MTSMSLPITRAASTLCLLQALRNLEGRSHTKVIPGGQGNAAGNAGRTAARAFDLLSRLPAGVQQRLVESVARRRP